MKTSLCLFIFLCLGLLACKRYEIINGESRMDSFLQDFPKKWTVTPNSADSVAVKNNTFQTYFIEINKVNSEVGTEFKLFNDSVSYVYRVVELAQENDKLYFKLLDKNKKEWLISYAKSEKSQAQGIWQKNENAFPLPQKATLMSSGLNMEQLSENPENSNAASAQKNIMMNEWHTFRGTIGEDKTFIAFFVGENKGKDFNKGVYYYTKFWQDIYLEREEQKVFVEKLPQSESNAGSLTFDDNFLTGKWQSADKSKNLAIAMDEVKLPFKFYEVSKKINDIETLLPFVVMENDANNEESAKINSYFQQEAENIYAALGLKEGLKFNFLYAGNELISIEYCSQDGKSIFKTINYNIRTHQEQKLEDYFVGNEWWVLIRKIQQEEIKRLGYNSVLNMEHFCFLPQNLRFSIKDGEKWKPIYVPYRYLQKYLKSHVLS